MMLLRPKSSQQPAGIHPNLQAKLVIDSIKPDPIQPIEDSKPVPIYMKPTSRFADRYGRVPFKL